VGDVSLEEEEDEEDEDGGGDGNGDDAGGVLKADCRSGDTISLPATGGYKAVMQRNHRGRSCRVK
jgi:hypothetical protein